MRILEITNRKRLWGGEDVAADAIASALGQRHEVQRCLFDSKDWIAPRGPGRFRQLFLMWENPTSLGRIERETREFKPDFWLVHGVIPVASLGIYPLASKLGIPIIHYAHNFRPFSVNSYLWAKNRIEPAGLHGNFWPEILAGSWQESPIKTFALGAMYWLAHRRRHFDPVSHWIAISDFVRDRFIEAGVPPQKITTLRHFRRLENADLSNVRDGSFYLFLGRLSVEKGVRFLLETWEDIYRSLGVRGPKLILAGDGPLESEVCAAQAANPLVELRGFVNGAKKQELLMNARAVVVPSLWWEGLGLVAYEAFDYGKPVLAARSGGLQEVVLHGETGFKHAPGDRSELAAHVKQLENTPGLAEEMGRAGRRWVEKNANEPAWLSEFERIATRAI